MADKSCYLDVGVKTYNLSEELDYDSNVRWQQAVWNRNINVIEITWEKDLRIDSGIVFAIAQYQSEEKLAIYIYI